MSKTLRTGRTTGSCASAAAMSGVIALLTGSRPTAVDVPLPPGGSLSVPIERYEPDGENIRVTVMKDGGDDPDATHGTEIQAVVSIESSHEHGLSVDIDGGTGVGRVTLPGLPVAVGKAAINPEPLRQIETAIRAGAGALEGKRIVVVIEVPNGATIAPKTMNSRLGIIGGISILGTQGIVKPFSHASWIATIEEGLDVAKAQGLDTAIFTTGRRSERLYQEAHPHIPELAMIQAADFFESAMQAAAERHFPHVTWSLFFGKLVKQAQGLPYTHAKTHPVDFDRLANWCESLDVAAHHIPVIRGANTAVQVLAMLENDPARPALIDLLIRKASASATAFADGRCTVSYMVFDFDGRTLGTSQPATDTAKYSKETPSA
ncbi:cobalt-precorrin-5B (C(1))-methyltransferase [Pseudodesulfovibrio sp. JC047]|uniref:cobalt-precorrin-5B (C(1))-methyltransferase CbiD n=1 Tax=Pseudodesulfovibrio sp. JC047 TaxID=2683199 RepID=UPI0013D86CE5|nr:cobalt-precorrin-5B (C(1))-methyltransferase CbiD [Pseudodesulfovibrio sp. JC047]NDV19668.1 cobalt-precorrin-5B (C(1))-methyltransferase [Pseudodesulfovibrio sp. JC047]